MYVYMYNAALYCEACGVQIREDLTKVGKAPEEPDDESSYDSDEFPKGPFPEGEADSPQHCDGCGEFLENDLTSEGTAYVRRMIEDSIVNPSPGDLELIAQGKMRPVLAKWQTFYGIEPEDPRAVRLARLAPNMREIADEKTGELPVYAWPGGYPVFYVAGDSVCCPACANDPRTGVDAFNGDKITAGDANYEDPDLYCECGERIESAYAEEERETEGKSE